MKLQMQRLDKINRDYYRQLFDEEKQKMERQWMELQKV